MRAAFDARIASPVNLSSLTSEELKAYRDALSERLRRLARNA